MHTKTKIGSWKRIFHIPYAQFLVFVPKKYGIIYIYIINYYIFLYNNINYYKYIIL